MKTRKRTLALAMLTLGLLAACGADDAPTSVRKAREAIDKGDFQTGSIHAKNALKQDPTSAQARLVLGRLLLEHGDPKGAEIELRRAQEYGAKVDEVAPYLAQVLLMRGDHARIISDYSSVTSTDADRQAEIVGLVATALLYSGQRAKAEDVVRAAAARSPDHPAVRLIEARLAASSGNIDGALSRLDGVSASGSWQDNLLRLRGDLLLLGKGDHAGARSTYVKLVDSYIHGFYALSQLTKLATADKDMVQARRWLQQLARKYPTHPYTKYLEASIAMSAGEFAKAKELITPLVGSMKDDAAVLALAGSAELQLNSLERAEALLRRSLTINSQSDETRRLLALTYLRKGEPVAALEVLVPALKAERPPAADLKLVAQAHLMNGNAKLAAEFFDRAARQEPNDVEVRTARAMALASTGQLAPAIADLEAIAAADQGTTADMALVSAKLRGGDLDGALAAINALEKKSPRSAVPADLRGRVLLLKPDGDNARAAFETALTREAGYFPAASALARFDVADGKIASAEQRYEGVLKANPKNVGALIALSGLKALRRAPAGEVTHLINRAIEANPNDPATRTILVEYWLTLPSPKQAVDAAQVSLAAMPDEPLLLIALGRSQVMNGQAEQAVNTFGKLVLQQPKSSFALVSLADAYVAARDSDGAERALRQALTLDPELLAAQRKLIELAVRLKQPAKALEITRNIQKQRPTSGAGYLLEGDIHSAFKNWDAAAKSYQAALQGRDAGLAAVRLHLLLMHTKGRDEADAFAIDWAKRHDKDIAVRWQLARELAKAGEFDKAEQWYTAVVNLAPNDVAAVNDLAWIMARNGKPDALAMANRAIKLSPENPAVLDTLADALSKQGNYARAITVSQSAVRLAPDAPILRLNLAKHYLSAKEIKSAKSELAQVIKLGSNSAEYREAVELNKTLE